MAKSTDVMRELVEIEGSFGKPAVRELREHVESTIAKPVSISSDLGTLREQVAAMRSDVGYVLVRLDELLASLKE